jgi:hypothetical protein
VIDPEADAETVSPIVGDDPALVKTVVDTSGVI